MKSLTRRLHYIKIYHWLWVLGFFLFLLGLYRNEAWNIFINAVMICLSCIGIG